MEIGLTTGNWRGAASDFWSVMAGVLSLVRVGTGSASPPVAGRILPGGVTCAESGALVGETTGPTAGGAESLQPASVRVKNKTAKRKTWWRNFDCDAINL